MLRSPRLQNLRISCTEACRNPRKSRNKLGRTTCTRSTGLWKGVWHTLAKRPLQTSINLVKLDFLVCIFILAVTFILIPINCWHLHGCGFWFFGFGLVFCLFFFVVVVGCIQFPVQEQLLKVVSKWIKLRLLEKAADYQCRLKKSQQQGFMLSLFCV